MAWHGERDYSNVDFKHRLTSDVSLLDTVFSKAEEQYNWRVLNTGKDWDTVSVESLRGPMAIRDVCFKYLITFLK